MIGISDMGQAETIDFLASGAAFDPPGSVEIVETHGAYVFLCGDTALKLKRAVKYDYMDLSTVELRRDMVARELDLNLPLAPEIYRDMLPVTRTDAGLALGGKGSILDWVLRMWRFPSENEFERIVERGDFDERLADAVGKAIFGYHAGAPIRIRAGRCLIEDIVEELDRVFAEFVDTPGTERVGQWLDGVRNTLKQVGELLDARGRGGHVRRAHGDLHLRNLVLIDGRPVPFDALEFDETLGTCDVLYDIAFLIMDLCHRGLQREACFTLSAWLREARGKEDAGLAALPLFLSVRAAIRAMVLLQTDHARGVPRASAEEVIAYLDLACRALENSKPSLVALGGFSGSGKSVLAKSLAPRIGRLPGAVILNSDQERKAGLSQRVQLNEKNYGADQREAVYHAMFERAETILSAGHSVILDATFINQSLRNTAEALAGRAKVPFHGLWLEAPAAVLAARVGTRVDDVSDADLTVLESQLAAELGEMSWSRLKASSNAREVEALALEEIGL